MTTDSNNDRYQTITFKANTEIVRKLNQEAKEKDVSMDGLLNQIVEQHYDWHLPSYKAGFIPVRALFITRLLDEIYDEEKIRSIARELAQNLIQSLLVVLKDEHNIESTLNLIERWSGAASFQYKHEISNDKTILHRFTIHHQMGRRWSIYLSELFWHIFSQFKIKEMHFDTTGDNTLLFMVNTENKNFYSNSSILK